MFHNICAPFKFTCHQVQEWYAHSGIDVAKWAGCSGWHGSVLGPVLTRSCWPNLPMIWHGPDGWIVLTRPIMSCVLSPLLRHISYGKYSYSMHLHSNNKNQICQPQFNKQGQRVRFLLIPRGNEQILFHVFSQFSAFKIFETSQSLYLILGRLETKILLRCLSLIAKSINFLLFLLRRLYVVAINKKMHNPKNQTNFIWILLRHVYNMNIIQL